MPIDINAPLKLLNVLPATVPPTSFDVEPPGGGAVEPKIQGDDILWGSTIIAQANVSADLKGTPVGGGNPTLQVINFDGAAPVTLDPDWGQVTSLDEYYYNGNSSDYVTTVETNDGVEAITIRG